MKETELREFGANFNRRYLEGFCTCPECKKEFRWYIKGLLKVKKVIDGVLAVNDR